LFIKFAARLAAGVVVASFLPLLAAAQETAPPSGTDLSTQEQAQAPAAEPTVPSAPSMVKDQAPATAGAMLSKEQPKRILGIMPNYRAVSAGAIAPPPTPKQAFKIATLNSFDYSSFVFVSVTSAFAEWSDAHPKLGEGMPGFGRYYWRGLVDKTDGNYMVIFAFPTVLHEDERYYAMGEGKFLKRGIYAATRILITPNYDGKNTLNASEIFGRAAAQGVSLSYYPSSDRTAGALAVKYGWAMGRDALTNVFREFWPDIATHALHRHP
jgi:hypothetical protein